jgi:hypothetical protein
MEQRSQASAEDAAAVARLVLQLDERWHGMTCVACVICTLYGDILKVLAIGLFGGDVLIYDRAWSEKDLKVKTSQTTYQFETPIPEYHLQIPNPVLVAFNPQPKNPNSSLRAVAPHR